MNEPETTCANHPDRETGLRCNRCGKPICSECAVLTPVGYRCKQCIREQQQQFETARTTDFAITGFAALVAGAIASLVLGMFGLWGLLLAPVLGGVLGDLLQRITRPRRSRYMPWAAAGGAAAGILFAQIWKLLPYLAIMSGSADLSWIFPTLLWPVIQGAIIVITCFSRMKGIRF